MEEKSSIYYPIYKKIENEVIGLSSYVYFNDNQKDVYSFNIADLIVRCEVEIESIAKDIYRTQTKQEPETAGECILWMEENWNISKKKISIITASFHFDKIKEFRPFEYKRGSQEDYYSIYNAIKHDRAKNIHKATIYTLVRVLGALYILNIYYQNEIVQLNRDIHAKSLDRSWGSGIFAIDIAPCKDSVVLDSERDILPEQCIYKIVRKFAGYAFWLNYVDIFGELNKSSLIIGNEKFREMTASYVGRNISEVEFWNEISKCTNVEAGALKQDFYNKHNVIEVKSVIAYKMKTTYQAELNK